VVAPDATLAEALSKALLIMLLVAPQSILSVGLQLSFAATLAVLLCFERMPDALLRPSASESRWRRSLHACARGAGTAFVMSLAVEVFIAPLQIHHFGQVSVVGPLATVAFLVPVTIVQVLALAASFDLPAIGGGVMSLLSWASGVTRDAIVAVGAVAPAPIVLPQPHWVAYYAAVCVVCARPRRVAAWSAAVVLGVLAFLGGG
jgi:competence protein ComEC